MRKVKHTTEESTEMWRQIEASRPQNAMELHRFVELTLGLRAVRKAIVPGNDAPFDYLRAAYFEDNAPGRAAKPHATSADDLIVWASRGGGKTMLGAVATLLDLVFKPGIQVRILGGSLQQSQRMYEYLRDMIERELFRPLLKKPPTEREIVLLNGSAARLLTQSSTSVRGEHVHKLRCDELDDYDMDVWQAAQLATKSSQCGQTFVRGRIEALSTMHLQYGPMSKVIAKAKQQSSRPGSDGDDVDDAPREREESTERGEGAGRIIRWSALDVIARCPADRPCEGCKLWNHCQGRAKEAAGYIAVDDMIRLFERTSNDTWAAEMMCLSPSRDGLVYKSFDPTPGGPHVTSTSPGGGPRVLVGAVSTCSLRHPEERGIQYALRMGGLIEPGIPEPLLVGGIDFGIRDPFVMLWARLIPPADAAKRRQRDAWSIEIVDEFIEEGLTLDQAVTRFEGMGWPKPKWIGIDPAGGQRNRQTGISDAAYLRKRGYRVVAKASRIAEGIELIRRRLDRGTLRIDPACSQLIRAMREYHFEPNSKENENPAKDGPDHACDALRYLVVSLEFSDWGTEFGSW